MSDRFTKTDLEKAKEATKRIRDKRAQKRMKNSRPEKKGSSITDIFKSYGKYDGKPIELQGGGMSAGQKKIAAKAPPPNKIDAKDFAVLRAEKAKGRGMGLQDEKVKPGKVQKANLGLMFMKKAKDKGAKGVEFLSPIALAKRMFNKKSGGVMKARVGKSIKTGRISDMSFDEKMKRVASGQINKKTGKFTSMNAMRDAKGFQKGESAADFNKRRKKIMEAAKVAKSTRVGKMLLPVVAGAIAAKTYLNSKMNKKKDVKKKMGGGMIGPSQRPGYSKGTMVQARGCKLGRTRPTKIT